MGIYGAVFKSERGRFITDVFEDLRGGRAALNTIDYATETPKYYGAYPIRIPKSISNGYVKHEPPVNEVIEALKKDRAAVAAWLEEQGLKSK